MQWMRLVLVNRLQHNPAQFAAKGATSITDIVRAKGQIQAFGDYPDIGVDQRARIENVIAVANDDNDPRQNAFAAFVNTAIKVATDPVVPDPTGPDSFLSGWMTVGYSPGDNSIKFGAPLMDNQFLEEKLL